ncbi:MAG TPA: hypothetical protein VGO80_12020 [Solirubrobacteraceae bacterium]|jgi:hypothetical protein|nr:hypothetical protein [Solirubrobacteraceae bacterium]
MELARFGRVDYKRLQRGDCRVCVLGLSAMDVAIHAAEGLLAGRVIPDGVEVLRPVAVDLRRPLSEAVGHHRSADDHGLKRLSHIRWGRTHVAHIVVQLYALAAVPAQPCVGVGRRVDRDPRERHDLLEERRARTAASPARRCGTSAITEPKVPQARASIAKPVKGRSPGTPAERTCAAATTTTSVRAEPRLFAGYRDSSETLGLPELGTTRGYGERRQRVAVTLAEGNVLIRAQTC